MKFLIFACAPLLASSASAQITSFCPPQPNSTGVPALLAGSFGSGVGSGLHLEVSGGVPTEFGYFVVGTEATPPVAISNGLLCLTGTATAQVYRFNVGFGSDGYSVGQFDAAGVMQNLGGTSTTGTGYDVPATIPDTVPIAITAGSTWHFQCWYRDGVSAQGSGNFSDGLSVTFQPPGTPIPGMVAIPAGTFLMGSDAPIAVYPYYNQTNTQPVHPVTISYGFWMGQYEVTQAEYQALMGSNPSYWVGHPTYPVEQVSWHMARDYCAALTAQQSTLGNVPSGFEYRLPTEAEWEYACRAGTTTEFNVGSDLFCDQANFTYSYHSNSYCTIFNSNVAVGSYAPNAFGLYDMHGNVKEWCLDTYSPYPSGAVVDPFVTGGNFLILRGGGGSYTYSSSCRSACRGTAGPGGWNSIGFRVVLAPILVATYG